MKNKILITGNLHNKALELFRAAPDVEVDYQPDLPYDQILPIIKDFHALVTRSETKITAELIDHGKSLKVIARAAVGVGNIDIDYATEKGLLVINTPGKNTNSAAELAFGLLLAVARNIMTAHDTMKKGGWERHRFTGMELGGKTIGLIGLGNVGSRMANFARSFGMDVLAYDPYISDDVFETHKAHKVDLATLMAKSDVVSIHTPQTPETTNIISGPEFKAMKDGVIILNSARGGLINEEDLLEALNSGKVAGAGIDTWAKEPLGESPFTSLPNVVMTPHIGASTLEAQIRIAETIAEQTLRALRDEVVDYPVNMPRIEVLTTPRVKSYTVLAEKLGSFAMQFMDFNPKSVHLLYRGELSAEEGPLIRRAFLKGFLKNTADETITFVNAEKKATERGITVEDENDPSFSDYTSALKIIVEDHEKSFTVGGVVFGTNNYRLSLVNGFTFEVIPDGHLLGVVNNDRPGVIGQLGTLLGEAGVNISQFELSRNMPGGQAMSLVRTDDSVPDHVMEKLRAIANVVQVLRIHI